MARAAAAFILEAASEAAAASESGAAALLRDPTLGPECALLPALLLPLLAAALLLPLLPAAASLPAMRVAALSIRGTTRAWMRWVRVALAAGGALLGAAAAAEGVPPLGVGRVRGAERARANITALAHLDRRLRGLKGGEGGGGEADTAKGGAHQQAKRGGGHPAGRIGRQWEKTSIVHVAAAGAVPD